MQCIFPRISGFKVADTTGVDFVIHLNDGYTLNRKSKFPSDTFWY